MEQRFTTTTFYIWSGLLIYALEFLFVYIFAALACAKGFAHHRWWGLPLVPMVTTASGIIAALAIAAIVYRACAHCVEEPRVPARFRRFVAAAAGLLSLIAVAWLTLPPLLLTGGCGT